MADHERDRVAQSTGDRGWCGQNRGGSGDGGKTGNASLPEAEDQGDADEGNELTVWRKGGGNFDVVVHFNVQSVC